MFRHLLKLIWNKKKHHLLLVVEIFVSFLVIFSLTSMLVYYYRNYMKPAGIDDRNIWQVNYYDVTKPKQIDSLRQFYAMMYQQLKNTKGIEEVSFVSNNTPYSANMHRSSVGINKRNAENTDIYEGTETYASLLGMQMESGRWYTKDDMAGKYPPAVIGVALKEELFPDKNAEGQVVKVDDTEYKVVGVVKEAKYRGDFQESGKSVFIPLDTSSLKRNTTILMKVSPAVFNDANFEGQVYKQLVSWLKGVNIEIQHLDERHRSMDRLAIIPVIILLIVSAFLIINVALGTFGVLWYNINKRKGEIGLRRAIGATGMNVNQQLIGESMVIATLALLLGCFFAVQFPLLHVFDIASSTYIIAMVLSVLFIYLLVLLCSIYPGKQAAAIFPATALHED
ncbi:putative ABC transport system permease protein [Chitinophaga dinghuensis]|uniref:Putative ABC transport system permease protein n=1 Tax=Chitinophaga dinghuensis TaxID=1539050 RepID=A0A327VNN1_9BACT|nr:ABC transporter permease [Chitinophaga dinghuensis]RAJ76703.1 putative ABC transport system permease protein [Chitinophaga dinghuensis]